MVASAAKSFDRRYSTTDESHKRGLQAVRKTLIVIEGDHALRTVVIRIMYGSILLLLRRILNENWYYTSSSCTLLLCTFVILRKVYLYQGQIQGLRH